MIQAFFIGLLTFFSIFSSSDLPKRDLHAIYVSVLEIDQSINRADGNIRVKVFANDLEDAIYNRSQKRIDLLKDNCEESRELISGYFNQHLVIDIDGQPVTYKFIGCEINDISIWISFACAMPTTWTNVKVKADYLMELFPTQTNVVSVKYLDQKKMFRLIKGDESEVFEFSN